MHVGFCENGAGYGGAVISLAACLEKLPAEFRPHLLTSIGTEQYRKLSVFGPWTHMPPNVVFEPQDLKDKGLPFASTLDNLCNVVPYALRYHRQFRTQKIDLVYLNNDTSCNMAAAMGARLAGLPLVLHARGFNGDTRGNRWVLSRLDHCIAVSHAVKTELLALGLPAERCTVVPEGLDLTIYRPRAPAQAVRTELGIGDGEAVITLVAGMVDWKGQDVLLAAAPAILAAFPKAHILLVGGAYGKENTFAAQIESAVHDPALGGRVRLLGMRQDIPDILSISDVVLHTSTKPEPFGRTFLEGMALGKAVIASNEGGPLDVIEHGVDGLLIAPREPATLADAVKRLLGDREFAAALGEKAAIKARAFSIEHHAQMITEVLRHVGAAHRGD